VKVAVFQLANQSVENDGLLGEAAGQRGSADVYVML
jgi:hypothetical protein